MTIRIYVEPNYRGPDKAHGGIRRVSEALYRHLPEFGIEPVRDRSKADVLIGHGAVFFDQHEKPFVSANHGMYWGEYDWPQWAHDTNARVTESLIRAQAVTVPSYWVRDALTRGMLIEPVVIHHGIDSDDWQHPHTHDGYVLWNKARRDPVSNPEDMQKLAALMPGVQFVTTIGKPAANVKVCGVLPLPKMKPLIQKAGVYLATARETFGIGTLEAMASGVPVAGWRYGGQTEIIREGETGYLADFGDYAALAAAVSRCLAERDRLSANAVADARERWAWPDKIEQYAALYERVYAEWHAPRPLASIIVTCHNLAKFLPDALHSVQDQSVTNWECIIVDDASTDDTVAVAAKFTAQDARFQYQRTPSNLKLSGARNFGFCYTRGKYVLNLDADDMLTPDALALLARALDRDPAVHIAYGRLEVVGEDGTGRRSNEFPRGEFNWQGQMSHLNQLHYAALMRREVWERSGGYRERMWRAEDAEFWCRVTSFGFRAAMVTEEPTIVYRTRHDSKGQMEYRTYPDKDGYWNEGFPWHQAKTGPEGAALIHKNKLALPHMELVPFSAQGKPPEGKYWKPWHRQEPLVSVIIPVGPGHARIALDALDGLIAQTFGSWEAIVVNDSGEPWGYIPGAPYAKIIQTPGRKGAGYARNRGLEAARAPLVFFLDADDLIAPDCLEKMLRAYAEGRAGYIYSDWNAAKADGTIKHDTAQEYDQSAWLRRGQHAITVLMATEHARQLGGFDEGMIGWEDWDFFVKAAVTGICGQRVPFPLLTYRQFSGARREESLRNASDLLRHLRERFAEYTDGRKPMAKCCGGHGAALARIRAAKELNTTVKAEQVSAPVPEGFVRMQFIGPQRGPVTYYANGRAYVGANTDNHRYVNAKAEDIGRLEAMGVWHRVRVQPIAPAQVEQTPAPAQPAPQPFVQHLATPARSPAWVASEQSRIVAAAARDLAPSVAVKVEKPAPPPVPVEVVRDAVADAKRAAIQAANQKQQIVPPPPPPPNGHSANAGTVKVEAVTVNAPTVEQVKVETEKPKRKVRRGGKRRV